MKNGQSRYSNVKDWLRLVRVKAFPENILFFENAIFRKGKCIQVFGCLEIHFTENQFPCLVRSKRHCIVLGLKPGETNYLDVKKTRFWTEPRHCIVLGLKPGETNYLDVKKTRFWTTSWMCNQLFKKKNGT